MEIQVRLMANMMLFAQEARVAEVEEAELYSPNSDLPLSYFHRASAGKSIRSKPNLLTYMLVCCRIIVLAEDTVIYYASCKQ